ncbi:DUF3365 domain-containing protein [Desulfovibrio mangrovi]|uniref:ATP-binding protein n=1 Tax=Desulfovibrio mangrovi TaxID=2976983 RepID=UPI002248665C|nr:DUF3365 domain-containing protein [Desulfovibrio mangrovi]UZP65983.1 DUF3365 domain-containing protein [Desulfovibrio mangrovi]
MHFSRPSTLQAKFLSGLAAATMILGMCFAVGFYLHMRTVLEDEVRDKARLIFLQVDSVQRYVRSTLRPRMFEVLPDQFVIEAMSSSFISREIMDGMGGDNSHIYRRVAISARNPKFEANALEQELVGYFRAHNDESLWQGYRDVDGEEFYIMARPVVFYEECMRCHGAREEAPVELLALYGDRGFDHEQDTIGGVDLVGLSVTESVARLQRTIFGYFGFFALGAVVFFSITNLLFKVLVMNNIKRLSAMFRDNLEITGGTELLNKLVERDEIEELEAGMQELNSHLLDARRQLEGYAENLRSMVEDRTGELLQEAQERRADVELFVHLLADMRSSNTRADLWRLTLPEIGRRFGAASVSYVCTFASQRHFSWPEQGAFPTLPHNWVDLLTESRTYLGDNTAVIPVESSEGTAEGLLCIRWDDPRVAKRQDHDLLQALGRQLGMAAENMTALDNLMRQKGTLQSIVEGITDPLVLMDSVYGLVTANQAARDLASELSGGRVLDGALLGLFGCNSPKGDCHVSATLASGRPHVEEVVLESGRSFALNMYPIVSPLPVAEAGNPTGRPQGRIVVYARETTREKRMLSQMQQSEKMITVGKLAAGLAHEINNPLGVILCYAELLRQNLGDEQQLQDLDVILRHTRQAQRVLKDLLNFARPKTSSYGECDAGRVAVAIAEIFTVQATKKGVMLSTNAKAGRVYVGMGENELEQVLSNLVLNALDAVPERKGEVFVDVVSEAGEVKIIVRDNGPGVSESDRSMIFDPFYTTKAPGAGTGLGLAIVYGMVTESGGTIEVMRDPLLEGARFTITLPSVRFANQQQEV